MLQLRDLTLQAPDGALLLAGLSLDLALGRTALITGPSGCGKSRLLKVLAGTERPQAGSVQVGGVALWPGKGAASLAGKVRLGLAFARGGLLANLSLWDNVALPLRFRGQPAPAIKAKVASALDSFGLARMAHLRPHAVSECARKFTNLARVLALEPALILLDDPLGGLESGDQARVLALIQSWAASPTCALVIATENPHSFAMLEAIHCQLPGAESPQEPS